MIKKIIKVLLLLVVLIGVYAAVQIFWERPYFNEAALEIERPAATVFALLTDPVRMQQWVGGLEQSVPLTEGGLQVGAKSREVMLIDGERYRMESEVMVLEPGRLLRVGTHSSGFQSVADYLFSEAGGGTILTVQRQTMYTGMMGKLFAQLINLSSQQKLERDLLNLKALAESM